MLQKLALYYNTIKYMKPSQIYHRIRKMLGMKCTLGCTVRGRYEEICPLQSIMELDFDSDFLNRFPGEEFMQDKVTFLYSSEAFAWNEKWEFENQSALWNFNLHYFEFLFPLVKAWKTTGENKYWNKIKQCIEGWIEQNLQKDGGAGWSAYTIALRLTNWISVYTLMQELIEQDSDFKKKMLDSMYEQYIFLSCHLEKDLLGNHYFEDLKTLVLCSLFFKEKKMLSYSLNELKKQCKEQILEDGMHFELSPMYHKIVFEDVIRVAKALKDAGQKDKEIENYLQPMLDVAYSFEEGLDRIPLFNDCGNNVAKSLTALVNACKNHFRIEPVYKDKFPNAGYYLFKQGDIKMIVDAGQPGPAYIPGHSHCDAMSFEVFKGGKAVIVNCGTYAYQCEERAFFRSTAAHNTVMVDGVEQSECWGAFRLAERAKIKTVVADEQSICMQLIDKKGNVLERTIFLGDMLLITDYAFGEKIISYIHLYNFNKDKIKRLIKEKQIEVKNNVEIKTYSYASVYGLKQEKFGLLEIKDKKIEVKINLKNMQ